MCLGLKIRHTTSGEQICLALVDESFRHLGGTAKIVKRVFPEIKS